jgi:D-amino-acid dehydrogenase
MKAWKKAMGALVPVNDLSLQSFDLLKDGGVDAETYEAKSFTAAYRTVEERATLLEEIEHIHASGGDIAFDVLTGDEARAIEPALSDNIGAAIVLHGQRFINPGAYVAALADSVVARGGKIVTGSAVKGIAETPTGVAITNEFGLTELFDSVVVATGAWLGKLARDFGVKRVVQAGRGYSFSVAVDDLPNGPVYFPAARVACTPVGDRLRVAGMMEFRKPEAALDPRRIKAIVESARPLLKGADLDHRQDEWVGSRPCTIDGLPLIGATKSSKVFVAGGHGMWGITLGPVTGRLLAEQIVTGRTPEPLRPFNPLR